MADRVPTSRCWCGEALGEAIGDHYRLCPACGTAALNVTLGEGHFVVTADERDFYGRRYWLDFQRGRGLPDIVERTSADLAARCLHWLDALLGLVTPPGRVLEIGCGHGGFVRLLDEVGFEAMGTELSPWVRDFARKTFGVNVALGPIEALALEPGFVAVCAFDVLEHVRDPLRLARRAGELLCADGVLFLQTPCYRNDGPEWQMFEEREHVFLFSEGAIRRLLREAGFRDIAIGPGLFPYDMWVTAAREKLPGRPSDLLTAPARPAWARALLTLRSELTRTEARRAEADADRTARLAQIETLAHGLREAEADRSARLAQIETLTRGLREAEADRSARLAQIETLTRGLREAEADRSARLVQIETLTGWLREAEADRAARLAQIKTLTGWLCEAEADRTARLDDMARLRAQLEIIHGSWIWRVYRLLGGRGEGP